MNQEEDPFYKKRFSLISEDEQKKEGILSADSTNPADFEEKILTKMKEERLLVDSVLNVPRDDRVPLINYPVKNPIKSWEEIITNDSIKYLKTQEVEAIYKQSINNSKKELQLNLILEKLKNSNNKLHIVPVRFSYDNNQLVDLITSISEGISEKDLYIVSRLYEADIPFDLHNEKKDFKNIVDIKLFEKALLIIKQTSVEANDLGIYEIICFYRIIQDFGPEFAEKITSGTKKMQFLKNDSNFEKVIDKFGCSLYNTGQNPYIFEELDKLSLVDFKAAAFFCQKIASCQDQDQDKINLFDFIYLSKLFKDKSQILDNVNINKEFLEKNNLTRKKAAEIVLFLSYRSENFNAPQTSKEEAELFLGILKDYEREEMPFLNDLAKQFNIEIVFSNRSYGHLLEDLQSTAYPLRFLAGRPDFIQFINNNFEVTDLNQLANIVNNILNNRINRLYESQLGGVKNLQAAVDQNKDKIENRFLLSENYTPDFINWLADLYIKTGYNILDAQKYEYMSNKLEILQAWYNDKSTFEKALLLGILGKNNDDLSGEYTSRLYSYHRVSEIIKDPEVLEFAKRNDDIGFLEAAINSKEFDTNFAIYWNNNRKIFEKAKDRGLFTEKDKYSTNNLEKTKEISEIVGNQLLLDFSDANPELNILQTAVDEFSSADIIKSINNWAQAWQSGSREFKVAQSIGLFNNLLERNIFKYKELAILYQVEDKDITQFKKIYDLDIGKQLFRGDELKKLVEIPSEKRWNYIEVVLKIDKSPSQEMQRIKESLVSQVLRTKDPIASYNNIENIFIKNNLPLVGKIFNIFKALHPPEILNDQLSVKNYLSPALRSFSNRKRYQTIFNDLLKIHVETSNRNLHEFLETLSNGQNLIEIYETKGIEALKPEQLDYLQFVFKRMNVVYSNSLKGLLNKEQDEFIKSDLFDVADEINTLRSNLGIINKQNISERLVDMFARPLGYSSIEQVLTRMNRVRVETDLRNRRLVKSPDGFELKDHNLLKNVNEQYIENILQNGSMAKEYLGQSASSDATPFDTDVSMVDPTNGENRFSLALRTASGYGGLTFVIKDRGQFQITTFGQKKISTDKMELFKTGRINSSHYGIRTGFPATEIDYMIVEKSLVSNKYKLEKIFIEIAQNGYYIPMIDDEKNVLLTPEKFDQYRKIFGGIDLFSGEPLEVTLSQSGSAQDKLVKAMIANKKKSIKNNIEATAKMNGIIVGVLKDCQIELIHKFETSIIGAEVYDTGSTARNTDNPSGVIDFDFVVRIDEFDELKAASAATEIKKRLKFAKDLMPNGDKNGLPQIRLLGVEGVAENLVDIDICFVRKSELVRFGSHNAVEQKLQWIKNNSGEEYYQDVIANIVLAKQLLKKGGAYKKMEQGGMGGIGVENWLLANQGNILVATKSFLKAAKNGDVIVGLKEFKEKYQIIDPGNNLFKPGHENFTEHLTESGYRAMIEVCQEVVTNYG